MVDLAPPATTAGDVVIGLNAVIVAAAEDGPQFLAVRRKDAADPAEAERWGLPYGPFDPKLHRTLEIGVRTWVEEETALGLGYVEQLYTFGDQGRMRRPPRSAPALRKTRASSRWVIWR